jgi:hypothetical protein
MAITNVFATFHRRMTVTRVSLVGVTSILMETVTTIKSVLIMLLMVNAIVTSQ